MLTVVCWKWGALFGPEYVNRLRSMFERHLHVPHELVCVTDDSAGLDPRVGVVQMPHELSGTPRCIRRLRQYDWSWAEKVIGRRFLSVDLDVVVVDDVTPLFARPEPLVLWKVGYAGVYSGSLILMDSGALDGLWRRFMVDPVGYAVEARDALYGVSVHVHGAYRGWGYSSDQPVLNHYVRTRDVPHGEWRDSDGIVTYFGRGYERHGPPLTALPAGARIVVLGSADKVVMDEGKFQWVLEHWR